MKNVLVITYWSFKDALIQTYTLPYVAIMREHLPPRSKIYLLTQEKDHSVMRGEEHQRISASLPADVVWVPVAYYPFGVRAMLSWPMIFLKLFVLVFKNKVSYIHAWALPAGAIGYILSVATGRKLVIDSYEPHAESMVENGTWTKNSFAFKLLFLLEKLQSKKASAVIAATEGMKEYAKLKYDVSIANFFVKPACVNLQLFSQGNIKKPALLESLGLTNKIVGVYAGKFGGIYYDIEIFQLIKAAYEHWDGRFCALLLTSHSLAEVYEFCDKVGLNRKAVVARFVPHADIPDYIGLADFALTPVKPVPSKRYCTPIKDGEYWALGLPIIITRDISDDADIIRDYDIGAVLDRYDTEAFNRAFATIDRIMKLEPGVRFQKIRAVAEKYRHFSVAHEAYRKVYRDDFQ